MMSETKKTKETKEYTAKIAVIGNKGVGKSALVKKFKDPNASLEDISGTIGMDQTIGNGFLPKFFKPYQEQLKIITQSLDFDGSVQKWEFVKDSLRGVQCAIVAFDLTQKDSLNSVESWLEKIYYKSRIPVILVGINKGGTAPNVISNDAVKAHKSYLETKHYNIINYFTVNTSEAEEVKEVFDVAVTQAVQQSFEQDFPDAKKRQELREKLEAYIKRVHGYQKGQATAKVTSSSAFFSPNSHEATPASDKLPDLNELLSQENLKKIDFERGFSFRESARGLNRKANYILAIELLEKLNNGEKIDSVFSDLDGQRNSIFTTYNIDKPTILGLDLGIQSPELKSIIKEASEYIEKSSSSGLSFKK